MFPGLTELHLIGCSIELIWTPRSKSNTLTPRTNSQTCWQRENFTRYEWTSAISVPLTVSRCHVRDPIVFSSTASGKPREKQISKPERTSELVECAANKHGETRIGRQLIKLLRMEHWRQVVFSSVEIWWISNTSTERPVYDKFVNDDDVDSDTAAESNLSLKSRSFLNRVNDRLRKMLDRSPEDAMQDIDKRSMIWWMFIFDYGSICIHGKELLRLKTAGKVPWKQLSLVNDEEVISLSHA